MIGFTQIHSETQDELTRIALDKKQKCIDSLYEIKREIKELANQEMKEIMDLLNESRYIYENSLLDLYPT